jgi:hypothetical protein
MLHAAYASPLVLEPGVSRYLKLYLIVIHGLALAVLVTPFNMPLMFRFMLAVIIVGSFIWNWRRSRLNDSARVVRLVWEVDGDWTLRWNDATQRVAQLRPETYESTWLVILHFQLQAGGRLSVVILPDMLDRQSFRRLRVRLRQARLAEATDEAGV